MEVNEKVCVSNFIIDIYKPKVRAELWKVLLANTLLTKYVTHQRIRN
jgi:hypothetical protein